jgi:hypothetical protein
MNGKNKTKKPARKSRGRPVKHGIWADYVSEEMDHRTNEYKRITAFKRDLIKDLGRKPTVFDEIMIALITNQYTCSCKYTSNELRGISQGSQQYKIALDNSIRLNIAALRGQGDLQKESPTLEKYLKGLKGKMKGRPDE